MSNHGGRQLDGAPYSISALPAIADAVGKQIEVHMDGGIRFGQDVLKLASVSIERDEFHGEWNYTIKPHRTRRAV